MTPAAWAWTRGDQRRDLGVGGVAEQRPPRLAALLDEARGTRRCRCAGAPPPSRRARRRPRGGGRSRPPARPSERAVQLALGREVLVDQRLRDARRVRDVVQRGAVVARCARTSPPRRRGCTSRRWAAGMRRRRVGAMAGLRSVAAGAGPRLPGMGVDFAGEGLLDGLDGDARTARLRAARAPRGRGRGASTSCAARSRDGLLVFLLAERLVDGPPRHRLRDAAEAAGVPLDLLVALRRANGAAGARPRRRRARPTSTSRRCAPRPPFRAAGVSDEQMLDVVARARPRDGAGGREHARRSGSSSPSSRGTTRPSSRERFAERSAALRAAARPDARADAAPAPAPRGRDRGARRATSAPPGRCRPRARWRSRSPTSSASRGSARRSRPRELGAIAERLAALAGDVAEPPVRLVKTIGDAAMLVSPGRRARSSMSRCASTTPPTAEGDAFPQLRIGVASGPAVARAGDWYGRPVNLASRITAIARPGSVLATREVRDAARDGYRCSSAGGGRCAASRGPSRSTARGAPSAVALAARHGALEAQAVGVRAQHPRGRARCARARAAASARARRGRRTRRTSGTASHASAAAIPTALIADQRRVHAGRGRDRPGERHPDRHQAERDGEVVGADTRETARGRHLLLDARVPEREEQRDGDAGDELERRDPGRAEAAADDHGLRRGADERDARRRAPGGGSTAAGRAGCPTIVPTPKQATIDRPARRAVELAARRAPGRARTPPAARTRGRRPCAPRPDASHGRARTSRQPPRSRADEAVVLLARRRPAAARSGRRAIRHAALSANVSGVDGDRVARAADRDQDRRRAPGRRRWRCCA